jgi:hypothetical protein
MREGEEKVREKDRDRKSERIRRTKKGNTKRDKRKRG